MSLMGNQPQQGLLPITGSVQLPNATNMFPAYNQFNPNQRRARKPKKQADMNQQNQVYVTCSALDIHPYDFSLSKEKEKNTI